MTILMNVYGSALTGREFGKISFKEIKVKLVGPVELDFTGVSSIGSSFADEFVAEIAKLQDKKIRVVNSNRVIRDCLEDVAEDKGIEIIFH